MYFWYAYIVWLVGCYLLGILYSCCLTFRFNRVHKILQPLFLTAMCSITFYFKLKYTYDLSSMGYRVTVYVQTILIIAYILLIYKDSIWKKLFIYILSNVAATVGEICVRVLSSIVGIGLDLYFNDFMTIIYFIFSSLVSTVCMIIATLIWKKIMGKKISLHTNVVFILFPLSQVIILYNCIYRKYADNLSGNIPAIVTIIISMILDMLIFYILMVQSEKEQLQKQLMECEQMRAIEKARYEEFEAKRTELAKFRHDYNNQLTTAILLEEQGNREMAKEIIEGLRGM